LGYRDFARTVACHSDETSRLQPRLFDMPNWFRDLPSDLRYATRQLRKSPGFAVTVVLTLALGIGANTTVFSIMDGTLLRPLPYRDPGRLVAIWDHSTRESGLAKIFASYNDFADFERRSGSFQDLAVATWANGAQPIMTGRGPARSVLAIPVSVKFFDLLGVAPALGRTFGANDLGHGCAVVLANSFWRSSFGSDPQIAGQNINLDQRSCTILGVMPPDFSFYPAPAAMWSLITPDFTPPPEKLSVGIFGRLRPGVSVQAAQDELVALHNGLHRADGQERDITPAIYDLHGEFTWLAGRNLRVTLWLLLGAVGMVLLIACFNVANMLLGRSFLRAREFAVRAALGGGRTRLLRQLLTEGLLLSLLGGTLGIAATSGVLSYFRAVNPVEMPIGAEIGINWPVLVFTLAVACITALIFGFAPAWRSSGVSLSDALKRGSGLLAGGDRNYLATALVAGEVALSVVLLSGAALLIESVARMSATPLGFQPDGVLAARLSLPVKGYADPAQQLRLYDDLEFSVTALPGVQDTAFASSLPPSANPSQALEIFGHPAAHEAVQHDVAYVTITPGYFRTLGVNLLQGRLFTGHDRPNTEPVAIIDTALAGEYFPNTNPIGQRLRIQEEHRSEVWATVVGVVATERQTTVYQEMNWTQPATLFRPLAQDTGRPVSLVIRTKANATPLGAAVRREVARLDSEIAVGELEALRHSITVVLAYPRFRAVLLSAFALFALLLAAIGLHGVLGQFTAKRTQEIGLRLALGARPIDVVHLVTRHGSVPVAAALVIGLSSAAALGKVLSGLLYGVQPRDPLILTVISLTLLLTAVIAISLPARRAARTDPMAALRQE
jgi:predicted permease